MLHLFVLFYISVVVLNLLAVFFVCFTCLFVVPIFSHVTFVFGQFVSLSGQFCIYIFLKPFLLLIQIDLHLFLVMLHVFFVILSSFCECLFLFMMSLFLTVTFCRWRPGPLNNPPMTVSSCFSLVFFLSADMPENHHISLMWTHASYPIILLHSLRPSPGSVIFVLHHQRMPSYTRKICAKINTISELGKHLCAVVAVLFNKCEK